MTSNAKAIELGRTPSIIRAPFAMIYNINSNRALLKNLIVRDFKVNYYGHFLGYFWSLLEPIALTAIFYVVFVILRGDTDTLLPLKIMIGILLYSTFSKTLSSCTSCLVSNASLIQQIYFPREIFPTAISGFRLISLSLSILIIFPYMLYENLSVTPYMLLMPISMLSLVLMAQGLGMMTASIQVKIRDTKQVVDLVLRAAFFLSGVFFGAEHIPQENLDTFLINPIAVFLEMGRVAVLGEMNYLQWNHVIRSIIFSFVVFIMGSIIFVKSERKAVKFL